MKLSDLLKDIVDLPAMSDCEVTAVCKDSRNVTKGCLFIAQPGIKTNGADYIPDALNRGAAAILHAESCTMPNSLLAENIPFIAVPDVKKTCGMVAARFYQEPSSKMEMIGITGTNGKTSTTQYIAMGLESIGKKCGLIGTIGAGFYKELLETSLTTPDAVSLQKSLADFYQQGADAVAMEVSSHALEQERTWGIHFDIAIFTNLTRDHLDYHGTMENYGRAKKKLFYYPGLEQAIINLDDEFGISLAKELTKKLPIIGYSQLRNFTEFPCVHADQIHLNSKGVSAFLTTPWGAGNFKSRLLGRFTISNLMAALATLNVLGVDFNKSLEILEKLETVPGRMQAFGGGKQPLVIVDYAHTPDALGQVLTALREHTHGQLWCIFGCGGDRDRGKRPLMGQIAERYSDQLIITDDNPRTENPRTIVEEIIKGLICPWAVEIEHDRRAAIAHVISCAKPGDVVLVAGRGHENYQIVGQEKVPFNDAEEVKKLLKQLNQMSR